MKAIDAAYKVLYDAGKPLHYSEITKRMLSQKLWSTSGNTPAATVVARLAVDIKEKGLASIFVRTGRGLYGLNSNSGGGGDRMTFTDAAEDVLKESRNHEPLHYETITKRALARGLIRTEVRTSPTTMYSLILTEIRRNEARGESPRFVQHGRGVVGLAAWLPVEVAGLIEKKNREVRQSLLDRAHAASPAEFESLAVELLAAMGFEEVELTSPTGDGGIDARGTLVVGGAVRIRIAVQAKRSKNNVTKQGVQQIRGSLAAYEQGLIITTADFSKSAKDEATRSDAAPVALINGARLAALLAKYQIGTHIKSYELYVLDDTKGVDE